MAWLLKLSLPKISDPPRVATQLFCPPTRCPACLCPACPVEPLLSKQSASSRPVWDTFFEHGANRWERYALLVFVLGHSCSTHFEWDIRRVCLINNRSDPVKNETMAVLVEILVFFFYFACFKCVAATSVHRRESSSEVRKDFRRSHKIQNLKVAFIASMSAFESFSSAFAPSQVESNRRVWRLENKLRSASAISGFSFVWGCCPYMSRHICQRKLWS